MAARVCARQGIRHLHNEPEPQATTNCSCKYQACLAQSARPPDLHHHRASRGVLSDARGRRRCLKHVLPVTPLTKATSTSQDPAPCSLLRVAGVLLHVHAALAPSRPRSMHRACVDARAQHAGQPSARQRQLMRRYARLQRGTPCRNEDTRRPLPHLGAPKYTLKHSKSLCRQLHAHA